MLHLNYVLAWHDMKMRHIAICKYARDIVVLQVLCTDNHENVTNINFLSLCTTVQMYCSPACAPLQQQYSIFFYCDQTRIGLHVLYCTVVGGLEVEVRAKQFTTTSKYMYKKKKKKKKKKSPNVFCVMTGILYI